MVMRKRYVLFSLVFPALLAAAGCATMPTGPSVMVMPAPGKPFDLFQAEDATCRQYAGQQIGASPQDTINKNTASGAVVGGVVGAGVGAALTGRASGAAFGAATGALIGSAEGARSGEYYGNQAQRRYDIAYQQCMYANGNMVPGVRRYYRHGPMPPPPDLSTQAPSPRPAP